jgi:hypothetical protein
MGSRFRWSIAGLFLAIIGALALAAQASAIDTNFRYEINPQHNFGKCLDVANASTANHARVNQFDCHNGANQQFMFIRVTGNIYEIRPVHSFIVPRCLDIEGPSSADGAILQQFTCNGQTNQQFRLLDDPPSVGGTSRIVSVFSGKCLDASNATSPVVQSTCNGQLSQRFDLLGKAD